MACIFLSSRVVSLAVLGFCVGISGCATALGPGYVVGKQEIHVAFAQQPQSRITVTAEYQLTNAGNKPLDSLEVRLPGRRFDPKSLQSLWDGNALANDISQDNPRNTLLAFPRAWKIGESHTLKFSYELTSEPSRDNAIAFSEDAFYLPAEDWAPQLPQARGFLGFGGVPPRQWELKVSVPLEFLVHASGTEKRVKKQGGEHVFEQTLHDLTTFVVAGAYHETQQQLSQSQKIRIWTRTAVDSAQLRRSGESLSRTLETYDKLFGARGRFRPPLWLVECPESSGCFSSRQSSYSELLYGREVARTARLISRDSVLFDSRELPAGSLEAAAGPALAEGWLGYGQNPGYYEQQPPMTALPAFATAMAREADGGAQVRAEIIRRALADVPEPANRASNSDASVTRAKSLLLFYAMRDRAGAEAFQKALQHMLYARQTRGFDVTDLISALDEETHQSNGPFIRQWIKQPGVPEEFRRQFGAAAASSADSRKATSFQETTQ